MKLSSTKLEDVLGLAPAPVAEDPEKPVKSDVKPDIGDYVDLDKIDAALPGVKGLDASDEEMDELADTAMGGYKDLMDLAMNVEIRYASEIFGAASTLLGHALTAKSKKIDKKLKMIDLQLKKLKADQSLDPDGAGTVEGKGVVLNRNELLAEILKQSKAGK